MTRTSPHRAQNVSRKRRGVYYTPQRLSDLLTSWAVRDRKETIFEPGFGACVFLDSIADRLAKLRAPTPNRLVYGCDVRKHALKLVPRALCNGRSLANFLQEDFLKLTPNSFGMESFHVLIGNPPYVSRHNMYACQRRTAEKIGEDDRFRLSRMASLWAYFVFHSLRFLRTGGRMAWVLPASAFGADYAQALLQELSRRFGRVLLISVKQRLFLGGGAEEASELLLCEDFDPPEGSGRVEFCECADIDACTVAIAQIRSNNHRFAAFSDAEGAATSKLSVEERVLWTTWQRYAGVVRLGDLARISIGIVTGANRFFLLNRDRIDALKLPRRTLTHILGKLESAPGLRLTSSDLRSAERSGQRCLLLNPDQRDEEGQALKRYRRLWPKTKRKENVTFAKRPNWLCPDDGKRPDAFLPYMNHQGPRLILNLAHVNSTNTIHRVWFRDEVPRAYWKWIAVSMLSSFTQLGAELVGRSYGGGILKHEIGEATMLPLIIPQHLDSIEADSLFKKLDREWRRGNWKRATEAADAIVGDVVGKAFASDILVFRNALSRVRARRWRRNENSVP